VSNKDYFKGNVMSNDNAIVRCFKLWAKISMMLVDGTRDATRVANVLQGILNQSMFSPAGFIGKGWSYAEARDPRSAALDLPGDYSKVKLSTDWLEGKLSVDDCVNGETRRTRILADTASTPLSADHFLDLWNNKEKIPEEWKNADGVITFDGDVLRGPDGCRYVLSLYWDGDEWYWYCDLLDGEWYAVSPSAVLASD
jgi:hypothetical protein